jgi:hypothetical protein
MSYSATYITGSRSEQPSIGDVCEQQVPAAHVLRGDLNDGCRLKVMTTNGHKDSLIEHNHECGIAPPGNEIGECRRIDIGKGAGSTCSEHLVAGAEPSPQSRKRKDNNERTEEECNTKLRHTSQLLDLTCQPDDCMEIEPSDSINGSSFKQIPTTRRVSCTDVTRRSHEVHPETVNSPKRVKLPSPPEYHLIKVLQHSSVESQLHCHNVSKSSDLNRSLTRPVLHSTVRIATPKEVPNVPNAAYVCNLDQPYEEEMLEAQSRIDESQRWPMG